jgi:tetratricopeptide (TPR) repeat protein
MRAGMAGMAELTEYERAQLYFEMNDYAQAAQLLEPFAEQQPHSVSVRLLLARAYYHSAQLRKAEAEFRAVTELDPVEDYAWFCRGRTLERLSRHAEAATCFRVASAMRPQQDYLDAVTRTEARESALASAVPATAAEPATAAGPAAAAEPTPASEVAED